VSTLQEKMLEAFCTRLESDPQLRRDFEASPLRVLRRAGVQVSPADARQFHLELKRSQAQGLRPSAFVAKVLEIRMKRPF